MIARMMGKKIFQSTLPQGERHCEWSFLFLNYHFNPRSHKGSDLAIMSAVHILCYFNPRSHKGSDSPTNAGALVDLDFNPRSHKGSDNPKKRLSTNFFISIHAPTRGATISHYQGLQTDDFNPRSHKGSDLLSCSIVQY